MWTRSSPKTPRRTLERCVREAREAPGRFWQTVYTPFDERGRSAIDQQHQMIENDDEMIIGETDRSRGRDSKRNATAFRPARCRRGQRHHWQVSRRTRRWNDDSNSTTPRRTLPPDLVSVGSSRPQNGPTARER